MSKSSKVPKILGGCGCLSLLVSLLMFGAFVFMKGRDVVTVTTGGTPNVDVVTYQNQPAGRTGNLATHYVGFKFDYPKSWIVKPQDGDSPNFVSVERQSGDTTYENFNVGYFDTANGAAANDASYAALMTELQRQFMQQYSELRKVSEGKTKVGNYDAYEGLFSATVKTEDGRSVDIYTRAILLPTPDNTKGVAAVMMGTSLAPELKQATDLGTKGELPIVLRSFRFTN